MKTTLGLQDELLARAKRYAKNTGRPLRKVVEDGLRGVLDVRLPRRRCRLPDSSVGNADAADPLEARSWPDLRGMIHGEYGEREHGDRVDTNLLVHAHCRESRSARAAAVRVAHGVEELLTRDRDFPLFPELRTRDPIR